jgi:hypothetical protein
MLCCGRGRLRAYGDSGRLARAGCDAELGGRLQWRWRSAVNQGRRSRRLTPGRSTKGITGLEDQTSSHRPDSKKGRRLAQQLRRHGARTCGGGARIGCPRANVSKTIIAAPQCMQTKVG